jgi:hypothetical protein
MRHMSRIGRVVMPAEDVGVCTATNSKASTSGKETLITSLLHEAAHNLGPSLEYQVNGQADSVVFGGLLTSMLEEMQTRTS